MLFPLFVRRLLVVGVILLFTRVGAAQTPATAPPPPASPVWLDKLLQESAVLRQHHVGVCVTDANTGQKVVEWNADKYFTPASVMKMFSLYTGLHLLGDSLPSLHYVVRHDSLIFWGTGDPTLLHGDVPSCRTLDFLRTRPEKLFYAEIPSVTPYGPGWTWDDYNYYYQPERGAFPVYGHTVRFYATAGQPRPRVYPRFFRSLTEPIPAGTPNPADDHIRRPELENRFSFFPITQKWVDETPFRTSPALLLQLLQDTLHRPISTVPFRLRAQDSIQVLKGLPVDSLYRRMLQVSDNFLAEQLLLMCSSRLGDDSLSTVRPIRVMRTLFLADLPDVPRWVDGSGLSRLNLVTPRAMTGLLLKLHQEVPEKRLLSLLAAGGGHGTLRRRYRPVVQGRPWLWGKTGTLSNNHNVVGYLRTNSGRLLAFSFLNNNIPGNDAPVRSEMEKILTQVRERL